MVISKSRTSAKQTNSLASKPSRSAQQKKTQTLLQSRFHNTLTNTDNTAEKQKQADPIGTGKVTCNALNVRSGAGTSFARIGGLTKGKEFSVYEEKDGWLKIQYGSDMGWISKQYTDYKTPEKPFENFQVMVTADVGLRLRDVPGNGSDPAPGSTQLDLLPYGTVVTVTAEQNGWYKVTYNGKEGWICAAYTEKYDPSSSGGAVSDAGVPLYCQGDSRWGSRALGTGGNTIKSAGCAMCSVAMCLSKIAGYEITPTDLDSYLDSHSGYSGDNIYWDRAAKMIGKSAVSTGMSGNKGTIDSKLESGYPSVIAVRGGGHYVCVAGRSSDGTYIIHDPGDGKIHTGTWNGSAILVSGYTVGSQLVYFK